MTERVVRVRRCRFRGGIAQLEEHLLCKQGVSGSNPLTSTSRAGNQRLTRVSL
jgi:hypothetical protein